MLMISAVSSCIWEAPLMEPVTGIVFSGKALETTGMCVFPQKIPWVGSSPTQPAPGKTPLTKHAIHS